MYVYSNLLQFGEKNLNVLPAGLFEQGGLFFFGREMWEVCVRKKNDITF